ncbi:uncharacterized protein J4E88_008720 [Alternaria novae-zelandiae]|uniref:uncharacterized protein n=1 Tax=Alternaria novae-zelandiae TaxID=430562 RepID=UPI0020C1CE76|nr:uncharacterized protein J4E88_008720 [Alternaria novae-zelandiae]KAI4673664.1 hypothetical protein J4E88_008720 [Alternaria novae-zelandiae]
MVIQKRWTWTRELMDVPEMEQNEDEAERVLFAPGENQSPSGDAWLISGIDQGVKSDEAIHFNQPSSLLQDQLRELEERLGELDKEHYESKDKKQNLRVVSRIRDLEVAQIVQDEGVTGEETDYEAKVEQGGRLAREAIRNRSERAMLLEEIEQKLIRYDEALANSRRLNEFQRPSDRDRSDLEQWLDNTKPVNFEPEENFIRFKYDLITLNPRTDSGKIDAWVEKAIGKLPKKKTTVSMFWYHCNVHQADVCARSGSTSRSFEALKISTRVSSMFLGLNASLL